jgi:hypothetical protein
LVVTPWRLRAGKYPVGRPGVGVIDYGVSEWTEMSPHWDTITFVTMLERFSLFSLRSALFWYRPFLHRLKRGFLQAYGSSIPAGRRSVQACLAVRHFAFAFGSSHAARRT